MRYLLNSLIGGLALVALAFPAFAQSDAPTEDTDPVLVFNRVCYAQVPVLDNIRDMSARFAWEAMGGEDLKQFTTLENPDVLEGWDVRIAKRLYRLGIIQTDVTGNFKENFPDFANGSTTACTLILDGRDNAEVILERMNTLVQKEPVSANVPEGDLLTTTWAGGNEDFKVFVFYKSDQKNKANLINVTILSKEKL
ncbi:MAG: hypothetical protein QNJ29_13070 [Rhizobiaceae bacterium]|nr:hypothetical protein [Rhizobiaceae bacterium]